MMCIIRFRIMKFFFSACQPTVFVLLCICYQNKKRFRKGVFTMQKNREKQNRIEKLTIKGTALHMCNR